MTTLGSKSVFSVAVNSASVFLVAVSFVSPVVSNSYIDVHVSNTSYIQPEVQTSYVEAHVANAAYLQPEARTSYIEARVQAEVTFPDVYAVEIITPTDLVSLATTKGFDEVISGFSDSQTIEFNTSFFESTALSDSIVATLVFIRDFSDTSAISEVYSSSLAKELAESIGSVDAYVFSISKPFDDPLVLLDNMDGDIEYQLVKTTSEFLTSSDSQVVDVLLTKEENATLASSGFLVMQDYCDITYFLENYVGTSRTFT